MNLRKSILALSVVAGIVAAPMTVFAAHTHSWGSPQYYGYEDEMPGIYDDWDKCATRHVYNYKQCLIWFMKLRRLKCLTNGWMVHVYIATKVTRKR